MWWVNKNSYLLHRPASYIMCCWHPYESSHHLIKWLDIKNLLFSFDSASPQECRRDHLHPVSISIFWLQWSICNMHGSETHIDLWPSNSFMLALPHQSPGRRHIGGGQLAKVVCFEQPEYGWLFLYGTFQAQSESIVLNTDEEFWDTILENEINKIKIKEAIWLHRSV